jgi:two-component system nitrate/nitrite response regulator NarL
MLGAVALRILVVDDSAPFRRTVVELLTLKGFDVVGEAADGREALAAVARDCPDGVLLDVNMPEQDGFSVSARLSGVCSRATIVLTSSETLDVPVEVLRASGAAAFVPKAELAVRDLDSLFRGTAESGSR